MSSQVKSWLLLAVIFIVGVVTGAALTIGLGAHFAHPTGRHDFRKNYMVLLTQKLNLTVDQQAKIQPILTDADAKIQALHHDEVERGSEIFKVAHDQISALLTPDQNVELQKIENDREKMFSGHMRPWGPPPPQRGPGGMPPPPLASNPSTNAAPAAVPSQNP